MVEYGFYLNEYHGCSLTAEEWPGAESRARMQMEKWMRSMTLEGEQRDFDMAICALAESIGEMDSVGELQGASIGSVSVEYRVRNREKQLLDRAGCYLDVYRGVG